jgi:hypothetical protein
VQGNGRVVHAGPAPGNGIADGAFLFFAISESSGVDVDASSFSLLTTANQRSCAGVQTLAA